MEEITTDEFGNKFKSVKISNTGTRRVKLWWHPKYGWNKLHFYSKKCDQTYNVLLARIKKMSLVEAMENLGRTSGIKTIDMKPRKFDTIHQEREKKCISGSDRCFYYDTCWGYGQERTMCKGAKFRR